MEFSNTSSEEGLVQEIDRICGTTANPTSYPLKAKTARVNQALDRFFYIALTSDGTWQFDDVNYGEDLPVGVTDLWAGQQDYTFASDVLMVEKALVKDQSGNWQILKPVDVTHSDSDDIWVNTTTGTPTSYDKFANSLFLDPIPSYDMEEGLKVIFKRNAEKFLSTDTTKEPGIPNLFHPWLAQYAALPYLIEHRLAHKNDIAALIQQGEVAITKFFSYRVKDIKHRLEVRVEKTK